MVRIFSRVFINHPGMVLGGEGGLRREFRYHYAHARGGRGLTVCTARLRMRLVGDDTSRTFNPTLESSQTYGAQEVPTTASFRCQN